MLASRRFLVAPNRPAAPVGAHASPKTGAAAVSGAVLAPTVLIMDSPGRSKHAKIFQNVEGQVQDAVTEHELLALGKPIDSGHEPQQELIVGFDRTPVRLTWSFMASLE